MGLHHNKSTPVTEGIFNLLVKYPDDANIQRMRYRMKLHAQDGKSYYFEGVKKIRHASIFSIWGDTTTLYITVYDGEKEAVLGKGIIKIRLIDFLKQMLTLKVINAAGKFEALKYTAQSYAKNVRCVFQLRKCMNLKRRIRQNFVLHVIKVVQKAR